MMMMMMIINRILIFIKYLKVYKSLQEKDCFGIWSSKGWHAVKLPTNQPTNIQFAT